MSSDPLAELASIVSLGLPAPEGGLRPWIEALFGERYPKRCFATTAVRDAYALASAGTDDGIPFAGLINPDNPPSGPYGGTSLVYGGTMKSPVRAPTFFSAVRGFLSRWASRCDRSGGPWPKVVPIGRMRAPSQAARPLLHARFSRNTADVAPNDAPSE